MRIRLSQIARTHKSTTHRLGEQEMDYYWLILTFIWSTFLQIGPAHYRVIVGCVIAVLPVANTCVYTSDTWRKGTANKLASLRM